MPIKRLKFNVGLFFVLLFLVTALFHSIEFRTAAWNVDEYVFASGGQKILSGGELYKDFGDVKPPLIYYTYSFLYWLSHGNFFSFLIILKISTILVVFFIASGFYFAGKNLLDEKLGMVASLLFAAYSICGRGSELLGGRTEIYSTLSAILGIYFFSKNRFSLKLRDIIPAGILCSISAAYNTRFGIILAVFVMFILYKELITKKSIIKIFVLNNGG